MLENKIARLTNPPKDNNCTYCEKVEQNKSKLKSSAIKFPDSLKSLINAIQGYSNDRFDQTLELAKTDFKSL